jgi:glutathione reductase (NADPH)
MAELDFDLIVLGGGSGGLAGAFRAAEHGARVALLEPTNLGGTCVNAGCVPKKAMWLVANLASRMRMAPALGFDVGEPRLSWPEFITHRQRYIHNIHESYRRRLDAAGIVVRPTGGRLIARDRVACEDGVTLGASRILIATGGHPLRPDIPGADLGATSDDFFHWTRAPERVAIVGVGYVGLELAGVLQAMGSRVALFGRGPRLLESFDAELAAQLEEDYRQSGIHVNLCTQVQGVVHSDCGLRLQGQGGLLEGAFDRVLLATGRAPNSAHLGATEVGLTLDARGHIEVDPWQATGVDGIFAVGEVTTNPPLTPVAIAAARRLMDRLFGGQDDARLSFEDIPTVVFSQPPIGKVGLTEAEARQRHGDAVQVYHTGFRPMLHALAQVPQRSLFKVVCVGSEQRVVGVHLMGDAADEILQGFAVALRRGITLDDLRDTVAIHPTSAEEVVLMR